MNYGLIIFIIFVIILNVMFGIRACDDLHFHPKWKFEDKNYIFIFDHKDHNLKCPKLILALEYLYQFFFHFTGSLLGWFFIYCFYLKVNDCNLNINEIGLIDLLFLLFGFLGITGHLPQTLYGFVTSFGKIAESIANKISK